MSSSMQSSNYTDQSMMPDDPTSTVFQGSCRRSCPASQDTIVSLGGGLGSDGSELPTGPCLSAERKPDGSLELGYTYYHHQGWEYHGVKKQDYFRAVLSGKVNRPVSESQYMNYRQLLLSMYEKAPEVCEELNSNVGVERWNQLRRKCQAYREQVNANADVAADLKDVIKDTVDNRVRQTTAEHLNETLISGMNEKGYSTSERQEVLSLVTPGLVYALSGRSDPSGFKHHLTQKQADLLFELAQVDVKSCDLLAVTSS